MAIKMRAANNRDGSSQVIYRKDGRWDIIFRGSSTRDLVLVSKVDLEPTP